MTTTPRLVTFGETMGLLSTSTVGPLRHAAHLDLRIAGAESNLAIGVARLGGEAVWLGRVGDDEVGKLVLDTLRGQGVDVSRATVDPDQPTGLMLKSRRLHAVTGVIYYRRDSAGSRLRAEHLDEDTIRSADVLHVTGITAALSTSARDAVFWACEVAASAGVRIAFDPNHRQALWGNGDDARSLYRDLAARADVLLLGLGEAQLLLGSSPSDDTDAAKLVPDLRALGPAEVVVKQGAAGALAADDDTLVELPAHPVTAVDPVGAGDAFNAGYLTGAVEGLALPDRLELANRVAAFAVATDGDWEGLPARHELPLLDADDNVQR